MFSSVFSLIIIQILCTSCPDQYPSSLSSMITCLNTAIPETGEGFNYIPPDGTLISEWKKMIEESISTSLLDCPSLSTYGTSISSTFSMTKIGSDLCAVSETVPGSTGYGTYIYRLGSISKFHIQIPHPITEMYVIELGFGILNNVGVDVVHSVLITGATRDSDSDISTCQNSYYVADVSHNTDNLFYEGTTVLADNNFFIFQFHGKASNSCVPSDLYFTSGTLTDSELVKNLFESIGELYPIWIKWTAENGEYCNLGGTTNVEGRYINSGTSIDVCTVFSSSPSNFVHLELNSTCRQKTTEWSNIFTNLASKYDFVEKNNGSSRSSGIFFFVITNFLMFFLSLSLVFSA